MDYGINTCDLPVIVVYPDYREKSDIIGCVSQNIRQQIEDLWDKLPRFRDSMDQVPTLHVPNNKALIQSALGDPDFMVTTKRKAGKFFYPC